MQLVSERARRYIPEVKRFDTGFAFRNGKVLWDNLGKTCDATLMDDEAVKAYVSVIPSIYPPPDLVVEFYTLLDRRNGDEFYYPKRKIVLGEKAGLVTYGDFCPEVASFVLAGGRLSHFRHMIFFLKRDAYPDDMKVSRVVDSLVKVD